MIEPELACEQNADDLARECLYRFLAAALEDPLFQDQSILAEERGQKLAREAASFLREEAQGQAMVQSFGELSIDHLELDTFLDLCRCNGHERASDYDRIFGLVPARECPPYETEYLSSSEPFMRAQQLADIAGFYRAFGLEPGRSHPERPDYLPLELEFMAILLMKKRLARSSATADPQWVENTAVCAEAEHTFFREHLAWWVPAFTMGLRRKAVDGYYAALTIVLAAFVCLERNRLGVPPPRLAIQPAPIESPEEQEGCAACAAS